MNDMQELTARWDNLHQEGTRLAGGLTDLAQRGAVYHHLYEHSGKNHIFPLIAAHGALWARGYFSFGMKLGGCCAWQYAWSSVRRKERMEALEDFANAFRDINRWVCIETYASYHFTAEHPAAGEFVPLTLLQALNQCHQTKREGVELATEQKREVFQAFFLHEQETVVGPRIAAACQAFDWPLMRFLALQPVIRFAYFPGWKTLWFRDFSQSEERVANGLRAFDWAAEVGWDGVADALRWYSILPERFFRNSVEHFDALREQLCCRGV